MDKNHILDLIHKVEEGVREDELRFELRDKVVEIDKEIKLIEDTKSDLTVEQKKVASNKTLGDVLTFIEQEDRLNNIAKEIDSLNSEKKELKDLKARVEAALFKLRHFDKFRFFNNVSIMMEANKVKIGQIEKSAFVRLGYMARLNKPGNTSEPIPEFLFAAADKLGVSLDLLGKYDLADIAPSELYLITFVQKLKDRTIADLLDWKIETAGALNRLSESSPQHPLFSLETISIPSEVEYPEYEDRVVMISNTFDTNTYIHKDCFNLRMKNGATLYVMNITKGVKKVSDNSSAIELWMVSKTGEKQFLCSDKDFSPLSLEVMDLYDAIEKAAAYPKVSGDIKDAIDAFVNDDEL